ncbi:retrovirus-related Pol polyprotein from transposon 297 [Trichonephila clavipes]|uniref:Retrovirus-related Pol polyprotein from transposon 297 n=1 Tax=Trichonephila clavipes TaxID=2585209 RepID=A0A8X6UNK7_TRICX|nr:retrovirus-related Pol polyprotein from transposon 297 [Trichonephila clavipes]
MDFLGRSRKEDLRMLATELGLAPSDNLKIIELKNLITNCDRYYEEFVKDVLSVIVEKRTATEKQKAVKLEKKQKAVVVAQQREREFELEKMKIQLEMHKLSQAPVTSQQLENPKLELNRIIPRFNSKEDEIGLYLTIFERQVKFLNIPEKTWTAYLIGSLPHDIAQLIAREDEDDAQNYEKVGSKELKITTFDQLKSLIIADQIKIKTPANIKEHFLDIWADLNDPLELAEKLDAYDNLRPEMKSNSNQTFKKKEEFRKPFPLKKNQPVGGSHQYHSFGPSKTVPRFPGYKSEGKNPIRCYGCGTPGVIKSKCHKCTRANEMKTAVNCMTLFNLNSNLYPTSVIVLKIFGEKIAVCTDTGASHTIAGEKMFNFLQEHDVTFTSKRISFMIADEIRLPIMALSTVSSTCTLKAKGGKWHFSGNPRKQYKFFKKTLEDITLSAFELREDEGKNLSPEQARKINILLDRNEACFPPGGEPTSYIEHRIDTGDQAPIATSPYRMNPVKKEVLREQIEELLRQDVIEECESPYAAPVILVPKPNGKVRLCVNYRKLNSLTKVDAYPLPRMDDLLNEATPTSFLSTIDLQSGYHQVKVADVYQDKTAFVCPFGTYRYLRMPFGLRNAPATFQRLIDKFRSGLKDVFALSYLDDIIVLSETFEKHLEDLEKVFERLSIFKLHANRDKCHYACDRVKYLG